MSNSNQWPGAVALITASSVIMLAGCAGASNAPASAPAPAPTTPQPSPIQTVGPIPPVSNPRDITSLTQRPCELLTLQQATGFQLDLPADQLTGTHGTQRCKWTTTTSPAHEIVRMLDLTLSVNNSDFDTAYDRDRGLPAFEVTSITDYPAIVRMTNPHLPICAVRIKVAEQQSIFVDYEDKTLNKNPRQSCEVGKRIAAAVLTNVPPKS
ncbi:MAG: DUF3558 family protein [Pseudonocardiales bacterium]|nr:DUF3558 family protein [Pseudonocardiales bacterium]